jgi:hypothetical protein
MCKPCLSNRYKNAVLHSFKIQKSAAASAAGGVCGLGCNHGVRTASSAGRAGQGRAGRRKQLGSARAATGRSLLLLPAPGALVAGPSAQPRELHEDGASHRQERKARARQGGGGKEEVI